MITEAGKGPGVPAALPDGPVVVVGLGALGGSLARALQGFDPARVVVGVEPDPVVAARALSEGWVSRVEPSPEGIPAEAGVVVYAAPLAALGSFFAHAGSFLPPRALLTDGVFLNTPLLTRAGKEGLAHRWVSASPGVLTPQTGLDGAGGQVLAGAPVALSAGAEVPPEPRRGVEAFWRAVGGVVRWAEPRDVDAGVAWGVVLPQIVSNALAGALHASALPVEALGPEARAMLQGATTDPARWAELLEAQAAAVGTGLTSMGRAMSVVADLLAKREIERIAEFMERTQGWATGALDSDTAP